MSRNIIVQEHDVKLYVVARGDPSVGIAQFEAELVLFNYDKAFEDSAEEIVEAIEELFSNLWGFEACIFQEDSYH